jgi:hypothetical protein
MSIFDRNFIFTSRNIHPGTSIHHEDPQASKELSLLAEDKNPTSSFFQ